MKTLLAVLVALALPAAAVAKEPTKVTACGAGGCESSRNQAIILPLTGGPPAQPPDSTAPGYRVQVSMRVEEDGVDKEVDTFATWFVPSLRAIRNADGYWMKMTPAAHAALMKLVGDLEPFAASHIPAGGRSPSDPPPAPGGALPPRTYKVAPARRPEPAGGGDGDGTPWWLIAGAVAGLAALGAGFARYRTAVS
jgi:hypothetical protein